MKKLEQKLAQVLEPHLKTELLVDGVLGADPIDVVKEILEAIGEYFHTVEEAACYLLELLPDNEISLKRQVTETCALRYSISKE